MSDLTPLLARAQAAELELAAQGIPETLARASVRMALRSTLGTVERLPPSMREQAAPAFLEARLQDALAYAHSIMAARERGKYASGTARALRDGRWEEGYKEMGIEVRPEVAERYRERQEAAVAAQSWETA